MHVVAISSPAHPEWRFRIIDYTGVILEESRERFATLSAAVAAGAEWLVRASATDRVDAFGPHARGSRNL
jgi:hypothetical protein